MDKNVKKVTLAQMLPIITEKLSSGGEVSIPVTGTSMYPTLKPGQDYAVLKRAPEHLEKGGIPFYRREDGRFVLHRVIGEDENGYILCGDNQREKEYGIKHSQVIGVLSAVERNGKRISAEKLASMPAGRFHSQIHLVRAAGSKIKEVFGKKE